MPRIEVIGAESTFITLDEMLREGDIDAAYHKEQTEFIKSIENGIDIPDSFEAYSDLIAKVATATYGDFTICDNARTIVLY